MSKTATMLKPLALSITLLVLFGVSQKVVRADEVTISGSTTGTITGVPQLTFAGNTFTGTTALGVGFSSSTRERVIYPERHVHRAYRD
jgi:hypothetical protein